MLRNREGRFFHAFAFEARVTVVLSRERTERFTMMTQWHDSLSPEKLLFVATSPPATYQIMLFLILSSTRYASKFLRRSKSLALESSARNKNTSQIRLR